MQIELNWPIHIMYAVIDESVISTGVQYNPNIILASTKYLHRTEHEWTTTNHTATSMSYTYRYIYIYYHTQYMAIVQTRSEK